MASVGALKTGKPGGIVTALVLFDGINGIAANTRIRDHKRALFASDLRRVMRA